MTCCKIEHLVELYGSKYDYSQSIFLGMTEPIKIQDKETGLYFEQNYESHLKRL